MVTDVPASCLLPAPIAWLQRVVSTRPDKNTAELFIQMSATEKTARAYVEVCPSTAESVVLRAANEKPDMKSGTASFVNIQATCRLLSSCVTLGGNGRLREMLDDLLE